MNELEDLATLLNTCTCGHLRKRHMHHFNVTHEPEGPCLEPGCACKTFTVNAATTLTVTPSVELPVDWAQVSTELWKTLRDLLGIISMKEQRPAEQQEVIFRAKAVLAQWTASDGK